MRFFGSPTGFARLAAALAGLVLLAGLTVPAVYWMERSELAEWARKAERFEPEGGGRMDFRAPGVIAPATVPADRASLEDDEPVVGVEAGGRHRAYHLRSMGDERSRHVVNDVLGGKAVSVAYCNIFDCITAYGGEDAANPLDLGVAGLAGGSMLLSVHGFAFYQKTSEPADPTPAGQELPKFPYASYPAERTTWGRWKTLHPDTDLYLYEPPPPSPETPPLHASER